MFPKCLIQREMARINLAVFGSSGIGFKYGTSTPFSPKPTKDANMYRYFNILST